MLSSLSLFALFIFLSLAKWTYHTRRVEKNIEQRFWNEVQTTPKFSVKLFKLWEGDSIVTGEVKEKGEVRFWYGATGIPRITTIGKRSAEYLCTFDASKRQFSTGLDLSSGSSFIVQYGFEINSLSDLVKKYDQLESTLALNATKSATIPVHITVNDKSARCHLQQ